MEKDTSKRDDFIVDVLYFEPVLSLECRGDVFSFRGSSYCASEIVFQ